MSWIFENGKRLGDLRKEVYGSTACARKFVVLYDLSGYKMKFRKYSNYTKGWFSIAREYYPENVAKVSLFGSRMRS